MSYDKAYYDRHKSDAAWMARRNDRQRESYGRHRQRRLDDMANQRRRRKSTPESTQLWVRKHILSDARIRSAKRGLPFDLAICDIQIPATCPVFGTPINCRIGRPGADSPSLDRIDNRLGYTRDNVWVISRRANTIKSDSTLAELEAIVAALKSRAGRLLDGREWNEFPEAK